MVGKRKQLEVKNVDSTGLSDRGHKTLAMLTALEDEDKLNEWEKGFVANLIDWFLGEQKPLTDRQFERLEIIYGKFN